MVLAAEFRKYLRWSRTPDLDGVRFRNRTAREDVELYDLELYDLELYNLSHKGQETPRGEEGRPATVWRAIALLAF